MGVEVIVLMCMAIGYAGHRVGSDWFAGVAGRPLPSQVRREARRQQRDARYAERVEAARTAGRPVPKRTPMRDYLSDIWALAWEDVNEKTHSWHTARKERGKKAPGPVRKGVGAWMERKVKAPFRERASRFADAQVAKLELPAPKASLSTDKPSEPRENLSENKSAQDSSNKSEPKRRSTSKAYVWHCRGCGRRLLAPGRPDYLGISQCCRKGFERDWNCSHYCTHPKMVKTVRTYYHCTSCGKGQQFDGDEFQRPRSKCCGAEMVVGTLCRSQCVHDKQSTLADATNAPGKDWVLWWHCPWCGAARCTRGRDSERFVGRSGCCNRPWVRGMNCTDQCIHAPSDFDRLADIADDQLVLDNDRLAERWDELQKGLQNSSTENKPAEDKPAEDKQEKSEDETQDSPADEPGEDKAEETSEVTNENEPPKKEDTVSNAKNAPVVEITNLQSLETFLRESMESLKEFARFADTLNAVFAKQKMSGGQVASSTASAFESAQTAASQLGAALAALSSHQSTAEAVNATPDVAADTDFYKGQ